MRLFKVTIEMPVKHGTYYVVAHDYDEAERLAQGEEGRLGGRNAGTISIEVVGSLLPEEGNLILNREAAASAAEIFKI